MMQYLINFTCWTTVTFWTRKDDSFLINSFLVSNQCFSHRNVFQNGVNTLTKVAIFCFSKSSKFCIFRTTWFLFNFYQHVVQIQIMYGGTLDFQCICNGNLKYPIGKSIFAVNLPLKLFRAVVANADGSLSLSIHYLISI